MLKIGQYLQQRRYCIKAQLSQGGMGTVYLATDRNLSDRLVAIKENSDTFIEAQEQFQEEAVMLAHLTHQNLPRVTDHFIEASGRQYLVMDYVSGDDLGEILRQRNGALSEAEALAWMGQVMDALTYMHNWVDSETGQLRPIIHRDIKPSNIKRTSDGRIVLVDFGISKYQTGFGTRIGARGITSGYSPLEQYSGGTDIRSDIYAFGATLYTLLTGEKPPDAPAIASGTPLITARTFQPKLSRNTERVIERAMQIQAADRFQSMHEIRAALNNKRLFGFGGERNPTKPPPPQPQIVRKTGRPERKARSTLWIELIALVVMISIAVIVIRPLLRLVSDLPPGIDTTQTNAEVTLAAPTTPTPVHSSSPPPTDTVTPPNSIVTRFAATQAALKLTASASVAQTSVPTVTITITATQ